MSYILIAIVFYFIFKIIVSPLLKFFIFNKFENTFRSKREIRSKINKMNIQDAEFDEK